MNKCVRIMIKGTVSEKFVEDVIKKQTRQLHLEGTAQVVEAEDQIRIVVAGKKENVDAFIDSLHKGVGDDVPDAVSVEPLLKERDYRGVFRVLQN